MSSYLESFQPYIPFVVFANTFLIILLAVFLILLIRRTNEANRLLRWLSEGERLQDVKILLYRQQTFMDNVDKNFSTIRKELEEIREKQLDTLQKVGFIRFDAFRDIGGELSFSLALLNGKNEGIVISSLYGREGSRVYGKPVKDGSSSFPLSDEEKEAINRALGGGV